MLFQTRLDIGTFSFEGNAGGGRRGRLRDDTECIWPF